MYATTRRRGGRWLIVLASVTLSLGACGGGDQDSTAAASATAATQAPSTIATLSTTTTAAPVAVTTTASTTTAAVTTTAPSFPVEVQDSLGTVTIATRPERIVSLSSTATEMLFAIGAGPQVAAVDSYSDFPPEAPITDLSAFTPNLEAIAAAHPDLVIASYDPGDLMSSLAALGVPGMMMPAANTYADVLFQIEQLGRATGNPSGAIDLVHHMRGRIIEIIADSPEVSFTYYYELDQNLYSVTSTTFIGQLFGLLGLENIADPADEQGFGYPQLSSEYIIEVDPDLIFLADTLCCGQNAETVAYRPGWSSLTALANGSVIELDDGIASRWGPRIVDLLEVAAAAVAELAAKG